MTYGCMNHLWRFSLHLFFDNVGSATRVRRRRVSTPGMVDWGASKKGKNNEGEGVVDTHLDVKQETKTKKHKKCQKASAGNKRCEELEGEFQCDMDGCIMAFDTVRDLQLHKKNLCTWKGCGKHFHMHKYLLQHRRVHLDDRPLKCPWKGCTQAFKWAWARTEHIRVHTGERPYKCLVSGCGQTFRFVSDFSRHKRNTGHRPTWDGNLVLLPFHLVGFLFLFFAGRRLSFLEKCGFLQCHSDSVDEEDRFERSTFVHQFISDSSLHLFVTEKVLKDMKWIHHLRFWRLFTSFRTCCFLFMCAADTTSKYRTGLCHMCISYLYCSCKL